jgi:hypothetical protein
MDDVDTRSRGEAVVARAERADAHTDKAARMRSVSLSASTLKSLKATGVNRAT